MTALDRLVGVPDYADFAELRAGIGRASARRVVDGTREIVHVTVAGAGGLPLAADWEIVTHLRSSLATYGDPQIPVAVAVCEQVLLLIAATIRVHPDHEFRLVEPLVRAALLRRLGFAARTLGQPAYLSEAVAAAQGVPGVDMVDVDVFAGVAAGLTPAALADLLPTIRQPKTVIPAHLARYDVTRYTVAAGGESAEAVAARHGISLDELLALNPGLSGTDLSEGSTVTVFRGIRPAQLVTLSPAVPDTLILREARP